MPAARIKKAIKRLCVLGFVSFGFVSVVFTTVYFRYVEGGGTLAMFARYISHWAARAREARERKDSANNDANKKTRRALKEAASFKYISLYENNARSSRLGAR
jgi:hypothetical protein